MHSFIGLEEKLNLSGVIHSLNVAVDIFFFCKIHVKNVDVYLPDLWNYQF